MLAFAKRLFEHYKAFHAYGPPRLRFMGYVGGIFFIVFYLIRFTKPNPVLFDDIVPRVVSIVLMWLMALEKFWPERLRRYYLGYSYITLLLCLPGYAVLTSLMKGGGVPAISNTFIFLSFLVMLTDWRNTLVMLFLGTAVGTGIYVAITPDPMIPMDLVAQLPAFALIVIGGSLFKFSTEQIEMVRKLHATQALAGSIAHEMRNPLSHVSYNLQSIRQVLPPMHSGGSKPQNLTAADVNSLHRYVSESELAVKRGLQVISMTLDEVNDKPVNANEFAYLSAAQVTHEALQEYAFESEEDRRRILIQVQEDFTFRGDETAYLFVIFNLIQNALHHAGNASNGQVKVIVGGHQVRVRDNGAGIEPSVLAGLFKPFVSNGASAGTGLGLAYCERVMSALGGKISCESEVGKFTEFCLTFPAITEQESQANHRRVLKVAAEALAGKRLLIVDDEHAQRLGVLRKLQPLRMQMDLAADGHAALEALSTQPYDLVLLDLNMPGLDGFAVAERIRRGEVPLNRKVRIVAHTAEPAHLAKPKTQRIGMEGFVNKPCYELPLMEELVRAVATAPAVRPATDIGGRRVIVADDSPTSRKAVGGYLRQAGVFVAEASNGRAVLEHLQSSSRWDAILMDLNMAGMSGLEATAIIRASEAAWRTIPIIALTAQAGDETVKAARIAGMNDFMMKPVEATLLFSKLCELMPAAPEPELAITRPTAGSSVGVLNVKRLEGYRRIFLLEELLADYIPQIGRLVDDLERSVEADDLQACLHTMHSLLGTSGEAGAEALHTLVKSVYGPMIEGRTWPAQDGWFAQLKLSATVAQEALRAYCPLAARHNEGTAPSTA